MRQEEQGKTRRGTKENEEGSGPPRRGGCQLEGIYLILAAEGCLVNGVGLGRLARAKAQRRKARDAMKQITLSSDCLKTRGAAIRQTGRPWRNALGRRCFATLAKGERGDRISPLLAWRATPSIRIQGHGVLSLSCDRQRCLREARTPKRLPLRCHRSSLRLTLRSGH